MTTHRGPLPKKPCPLCGEPVKVYAEHLPCDSEDDA